MTKLLIKTALQNLLPFFPPVKIASSLRYFPFSILTPDLASSFLPFSNPDKPDSSSFRTSFGANAFINSPNEMSIFAPGTGADNP
jgi:hypothetical protein